MGKSIPVVTAGGIYDHADVMHQMELGADGVQGGNPFCDNRGMRCTDGI